MKSVGGFLLVFSQAARTALRGKRLLALVLLTGIPVLVSWVNANHGGDVKTDDFVYMLLLVLCQFTVPFGALFLGISVLGDEIDGRTITYLFTRPLSRPVLYVGRLLGYSFSFGVVLAVTVVLCRWIYASRVAITGAQTAACIGVVLGGYLAYMALYAALRALTSKALYIGFFITFVVEFVLSKLPAGKLAEFSVWNHVAQLVLRIFDGHGAANGPLENLTAAESVWGGVQVLLGVFLVSVAVGAWVVKSREIRVSATVG